MYKPAPPLGINFSRQVALTDFMKLASVPGVLVLGLRVLPSCFFFWITPAPLDFCFCDDRSADLGCPIERGNIFSLD